MLFRSYVLYGQKSAAESLRPSFLGFSSLLFVIHSAAAEDPETAAPAFPEAAHLFARVLYKRITPLPDLRRRTFRKSEYLPLHIVQALPGTRAVWIVPAGTAATSTGVGAPVGLAAILASPGPGRFGADRRPRVGAGPQGRHGALRTVHQRRAVDRKSVV